MKMNQYILAIDGGATKTTLSLRDTNGKEYFQSTSTSTNYQAIGEEKVEMVLTDLLKKAYAATNICEIDVASFAIAGIDTKTGLGIVQRIVEKSCKNSPFHIHRCIVENDVHATLIGLTEDRAGALVIAGTGAIAYATDGKGNIIRSGGWGHRVGDEGSGYWIGKQIINTIFRFEDGRNDKYTVLKELVFDKLEIQDVEQLNDWLYRSEYTNAQMASIATVLTKALSLGDESAIQIACEAARELFVLTDAVLKKLNFIDDDFVVYLNGGILKNNTVILNLYKDYINEVYPNISFILCEQNPIEYIANRAIFSLKY